MKRFIYLLIALLSACGGLAVAQETPPSGLKPVNSQFYIDPADSTIWQQKGAPYGWSRVTRTKQLLDSLNNVVHLTGKSYQQITGQLAVNGIFNADRIQMFDGYTPDAGQISIGNFAAIGANLSDRNRSIGLYSGTTKDWEFGEDASKNFFLNNGATNYLNAAAGILSLNAETRTSIVPTDQNGLLRFRDIGLTTTGTGAATYLKVGSGPTAHWNLNIPTPDFSAYVPYTGATGNINVGANDVTITGGINAFKVGTSYFNQGALGFPGGYIDGSDASDLYLQGANEVHITSSTHHSGSPYYMSFNLNDGNPYNRSYVELRSDVKPSNTNGLYRKRDVDSLISNTASGYMPLSGGTLTGNLNMGAYGVTFDGANKAIKNQTISTVNGVGTSLVLSSGDFAGIGFATGSFNSDGYAFFSTNKNKLKGNTLIDDSFASGVQASSSALLQLNSTTKGFLPSRMTSTQKNAVGLDSYNGSQGLLVYQTDGTPGYYYVNGSSVWKRLANVDDITTSLTGYMPLSGGTLTGNLAMGANQVVFINGATGSFMRADALNITTTVGNIGIMSAANTSIRATLEPGIVEAWNGPNFGFLKSDKLMFSNGTYNLTVGVPTLTSSLVLTLPTQSGTLALTSQIPGGGSGSLSSLTNGYGLTSLSYNGNSAASLAVDTTSSGGIVSKDRFATALALKQNTLTLTTTGTGSATFGSNTINIPTPTFANPIASIGLTAVNGSATTFMRSDAAPALDQSIQPTMTGLWKYTSAWSTAQASFGSNGQGGRVFFNRGSDGSGQVDFGYNSATTASDFHFSNNASSGIFVWQTNNGSLTEKMRLSNGGTLLIGTTTDDPTSKIRADGKIASYGNYTTANNAGFESNNPQTATSTNTQWYAPNIRFRSSAWNTTTLASDTYDGFLGLRPVTGSTTGSEFYISLLNTGGGYTERLKLSNTGVATLAASLLPDAFNTRTIGSSSLTYSRVFTGITSTDNVWAMGTAINFGDNTSAVLGKWFGSTGDLVIGKGSSFTDNATDKLQVIGTISSQGFAATGNINTVSKLGVTYNNTVSAAFHMNLPTYSSGLAYSTSGLGFRQDATTYTSTVSAGAPTFAAVNSIAQPTLSASNAQSITTAATLYVAGPPLAGTNVTIAKPYTFYIAGNNYFGSIETTHLTGTTSVPTIAAGAGAGTSPTVSIAGNDLAGEITITTGSAPTAAGTIVTVTYNTAYGAAPYISLTRSSATAPTDLEIGTRAAGSFTITGTLAASTTYKYNYHVIQ